MSRLEEAWVRWRDSATWRKHAGSVKARGFRNSRSFQSADLARRYAVSLAQSLRTRDRYRTVGTLCLMMGHTKSGGSLLGALLDAHPQVSFADEVDALKYFEAGFRPEQVYYLLEKGARREAMKGRVTARRLDPYSLEVPGQSQGRTTSLHVVGDSKAGITTQRLGKQPDMPKDLQERIGATDLRFIHVVRNPFDPISVMMLRGRRTLEDAVARYFANCDILVDLHDRLPQRAWHLLRYEDLIDDPARRLREACEFLELEVTAEYVHGCAAVVRRRAPERTRVEWDDDAIALVQAEIASYRFLAGYAYDTYGSPV